MLCIIIKLIEIGLNKFDSPIVSARLILLTAFGVSLFLFLWNLNPIYFTKHVESLAVLYFIGPTCESDFILVNYCKTEFDLKFCLYIKTYLYIFFLDIKYINNYWCENIVCLQYLIV